MPYKDRSKQIEYLKKWYQENKKKKDKQNREWIVNNMEKYNLEYKWTEFINIISSTIFKNRPGRSIKLLIKDKKYNFIYGVISLVSPMLNKKINKYFKEIYNQKIDFKFLNNYLIDMNVCVGIGIMAKYLSGKMLVYIALSLEIKKMWDKKYNTDIKYIMTTSLYGKSSMYNRIKEFKYLGLSEGWNSLFTEKQIKWLKAKYIELFPKHIQTKTAKAPHLIKIWNNIYEKLEDKMPFNPIKTQRGVYIFDSAKTSFQTYRKNIKFWRNRWYYPRKERINNETKNQRNRKTI